MPPIIPQKIDSFLGLNNRLEPSSPMYREGMAWRSMNARLDESGQWSPRQNLVACQNQPDEVAAFGSGNHMKSLAINNNDFIVTGIATGESVDMGPNDIMYSTTGSGAVNWRRMLAISQIEEEATDKVKVTTSGNHYLSTNDSVDVTGTTNFNTTGKTITVTAATTFTYAETETSRSTENTGYTSPYGTVTQMTVPARNTDFIIGDDASAVISNTEQTCSGNRAEIGTYFYMLTFYDPIRKRESLPSQVHEVDLSDTAKAIAFDIDFSNAWDQTHPGWELRLYRTKRTYTGSDATTVYSPTNIFYFVKSFTSAIDPYFDTASDDDIAAGTEYDGRGTVPSSGMDYLVSHNNRMLYFEGNRVYWSSPGRPEEVGAEYTLTYRYLYTYGGGIKWNNGSNGDGSDDNRTVTSVPRLSLGVYAESYADIAELAGKTVTGAMVQGGKCRIWTDGMYGYLKADSRMEGYRFNVTRKGIGLVSDKYIADTPYGIFGVDRQGLWLVNYMGAISRLSESAIDFRDSTKDTYMEQAGITNGFGVWVPGIGEYWWCVSNPSAGDDVQTAYQAARGLFVGPYDYALLGGTNFVSVGSDATGGAQACLNVSGETDRFTPSLTAAESVTNYLDFWFGQASPSSLKDTIEVEIICPDSTGTATASILLNRITSETDATSQDNDMTFNSSPCGHLASIGEARNFKVKLTLASGRKLSLIQYQYNSQGWHPQHSIDE